VIISSTRIGSPYVTEPGNLIVMNQPSLNRFEDAVMPGGVVLFDSSMINRELRRKDVKAVKVAASKIAEGLGNILTANTVALGAFVGVKPVVSIDSLLVALDKVLPKRHEDLLTANTAALKCGFQALTSGSKG